MLEPINLKRNGSFDHIEVTFDGQHLKYNSHFEEKCEGYSFEMERRGDVFLTTKEETSHPVEGSQVLWLLAHGHSNWDGITGPTNPVEIPVDIFMKGLKALIEDDLKMLDLFPPEETGPAWTPQSIFQAIQPPVLGEKTKIFDGWWVQEAIRNGDPCKYMIPDDTGLLIFATYMFAKTLEKGSIQTGDCPGESLQSTNTEGAERVYEEGHLDFLLTDDLPTNAVIVQDWNNTGDFRGIAENPQELASLLKSWFPHSFDGPNPTDILDITRYFED
jgi:hypothetical protein